MREAIWLAHNQACFYCKRPIQFEEVEIDHFIKRSMSAEEFAELVAEGAIKTDFNLESLENLVPACPPHNRDKGDLSLDPDYVAIRMPRIARAANKARLELDKSRNHWNMERICREIFKAEESGNFSLDDVVARSRAQRERSRIYELPALPELIDSSKPPRPEILITSRASIALRQERIAVSDLAKRIVRRHEDARVVVVDGMRLIQFRLPGQLRILVQARDDVMIIHDVITKRSRWNDR
ncbi:HNH endonuclease [Rhizobium mongolense]|uniref:HNH endonuclease n=2 Tax=Rhizobium mongolense TaxID=57676 RepID=A0ABR6ISX6_9HYPH|nr:HNH endonuclease signature motif containing protein [Rhizobium mongolense]MBB4231015.1 hypothetical protein [Rhizobium mongolense]TVZ66166.1 HNH endonuclease [Rhizobium mongolense USDA 1844]